MAGDFCQALWRCLLAYTGTDGYALYLNGNLVFILTF